MPNSYLQYTADGADTKTGIAIPTFKKEEIKVRVDGVLKTEGSGQDYEITSYSTSSFTIDWKDTARPTSPSIVRVYRVTDILNVGETDVEGKATYQAGSSVKAGDLNDNQTQALRALEEENEHLIQTWDIEGGAVDVTALANNSVTSAKIVNGTIVDEDISTTAEIAVNKLAHGTNNQILQSDNSGNVEWRTNVLVPGNLDVNLATSVGTTLTVVGTTTAANINASGAVNVTGNLAINTDKFNVNATSGNTNIAGYLYLKDDQELVLGDDSNFILEHRNSSNINTIDTDIQLQILKKGTTQQLAYFTPDGKTVLGYAGTERVETTNAGAKVTGNLEVTGTLSATALNADTLDSLDSTQFLRSDTADTFTGSSLTIADEKQLLIGTSGGGFQLLRDDTGLDKGMYITDTGKHIYYAGTEGSTFRTGSNHINVVKFVNTGSGGSSRCHVELYEGADSADSPTKRLETTSDGVTITGETKTTTLEIGGADVTATAAELNILDQATVTTSELNKLDGYTGDVTNLNIVSGMTKVVSTDSFPTTSDTAYPTAKRINTHVISLINDVGGFVPIADEVSFPTTNPDPGDDAGTIVSIADVGGLKVADGSGSGDYAGTAGNSIGATTTAGVAVTITGIDTTLRGTTIAAGKGMLVQTTTTLNTYTYHRLTLDEAGVANAQTLVSDFNERYRVNAGEPSSHLTDGDLVFDTNANKMKVYDTSASSWKEVTSAGDFKYLFLCPAGGSGAPTLNGSIATYDLREGSNGGSAASVSSAAQLLVSVNGVIQKANTGTSAPAEGFALVDTNTIIFGDNLATDDSVFIIQVGSAVSLNHPADDSVDADAIDDGAIANIAISSSAAIEGSKLDNPLQFPDNHKISFGTDGTGDLELYHDGTFNYIVAPNDHEIHVNANSGGSTENMAKFKPNGAVELYNNGTKRFETSAGGSKVTGTLLTTGTITGEGHIKTGSDTGKFLAGAGNDLQIYHDGTDSYITNGTNELIFQTGSNFDFQVNDTEHAIKAFANGQVELYWDNSKKLETQDNGIKVSNGCITTTGANTVNEADCIKVGYEGSSKGQIRVYGADASTTGNLEFKVSEGDGTDDHTMLFDGSGHLNIGTDTSGIALYGDNLTINDAASCGVTIRAGTSNYASIYFADGDSGDARKPGIIEYYHGTDVMNFYTGTNQRLLLDQNGNAQIIDGDLKVAAGHGINFSPYTTAASGSGSPDPASNLLDDYEEGTWTPQMSNGGTVNVYYAGYRKVGTIVHFSGYIYVTSIPNDSNILAIYGLPYTSSNGGSGNAVGQVTMGHTSSFDVRDIAWVIWGNTTTVRGYYQENGNNILNSTWTGATRYFAFSGTYYTDA